MNEMSKKFDDFEKSLNDPKINTDIKYTLDRGIEASVKYEYLCEQYGKEIVDSLVDDFIILSDYENFLVIKEKLEKIK